MKNIKKYVGILALSLVVISCSSNAVLLTSGRTFHESHLGRSEIEKNLEGRYNYDNDIAVASVASKSEMAARVNAEARMHQAISSYSYGILMQLLSDSNVKGPGFDKYQMNKFATEVADKYTRHSSEIGKFTDGPNKYYIALSINKKIIKAEAKKIFKERVNRVIERLNELKEGI